MFANQKIARKLAVAFGVIILAFVAAATVIVISLHGADKATERVRQSRAAATAARAVYYSFVAEQNAVRGFVISQSEKLFGDVEAQRLKHDAAVAEFKVAERRPELAERMGVVDGLVREWRVKSADKQIALSRDPATRAEANNFVSGQFAGKIAAGIDELLAAENGTTSTFMAEQLHASAVANWALSAAGCAMLVLAGALLTLLTRSIARPVRAMAEAMQAVASGDTSVEIPARGRRDEVGQMAAALQLFRDAAIEKARVEAEAAQARALAEAERERTEQHRAEVAALQGEVVARLGAGLSRLSDGDLTVRMEEPFASEYEKLRADFNAASEELQAAMQMILSNTDGLRSGTREITQAADDLARRTEQQAASLEQTAAALGEITSAVRKTADGAEQARDTVSAARTDAERSGSVVQDAVSAMSEIERSAQQISQIIGVIDEIAFQTNLLALNAGVEAARAGDAGRGFAVVASEVRALAQRSADAAKEIKTLISSSTALVGRGVGLVDQTGKSLTRIVAQVTEINRIVAEIATSAKEQATGLAEVNTAINQMDQVTQQNAAMVEQSTAASHALAREADELARLTARFRIGELPAPAAAPAKAEPVRPRTARRPQARVPARATIGGTALDTRHLASADTWEEF